MLVFNPIVLNKVVKTMTPQKERVEEAQIRGTIVFSANEHFVRLDGASEDSLTPIANFAEGASDAGFVHGDRVLVLIKNHQAIVTKNLTTGLQAQAAKEAGSFVTVIMDEGITAQRIIANDTFTNTLRANEITADEIIAGMATIDQLDANYAHITNGVIDNATIGHADVNDLDANYAHITSGVIDNATIDQVKVNNLGTNYAHITNGVIDNAKIGYADVNNLSANYAHITNGVIDNAKIGYADVNHLDAHYAEIDLANVNNAWIENGVVKDAAISDAQIIGVSANKLTAGTIDASNIHVTNLNADNITAGSISVDGITIDIENNEATIDGEYIEDGTITMNGLAQSVQNAIDGAIETHTGAVVPTLNNAPASSWTTTKLKDSHVGDIYYVINAGHEADGYCYRFAKSGSTYSWVLIQDSDVTAALSRLTTAEGKIEGLETFESETSSWVTDTDEELSSIKTNVTSLSGRMDTAEGNIQQKVDTSTFNTLSQTVGENSSNITTLTTITENNGLTTSTNITNTVNNVSQTASGNSSKISQLTTTLGTNADGTTKAGDIIHRTSAVEQDLSGFHTTVEETYATKASVNGKADASAVYTKSEIDQTVSGINASVSAKADGASTTAALSLKANKDTLTSEINASADTVKIQANRVEIDGTAIFSAISDDVDDAITGKGYATTEQAQGYASTAQKYATAVYGTCTETGASTAAKVVTLANFNLFKGAQITVKFSYANSASAPTLNVNSTGAKAIYVNRRVTSANNPLLWAAGAELHFTYDGSYWNCDDVGYGYSTTCSTAATTAAKTGAQTGAIVTNGTTVALTCTYANTVEGALSFNFASTGAVNIYQHDAITSSSNALVWSAGATVTFVRRGSYWYYVASTTIDGDNIKTGKIKANLGGSYIDLDSGDMLLGDASTYEASTQGLMWDESNGELKIKGQITVESGSNVYSKTDVDTAIGNAVDGIEVGGRNKAALSYIWSRTGSTYTTNGITFTNLGGGRFSAVGTATNVGDIWWCNADSASNQLGTGGTYTYSIYLESGTMPSNIGLQVAEADSTPTWKRNNRSDGGATTYTFGTNTGNHPYHLGFWAVAANTAINITFRLKFEEGNKSTDWSPAPEDVQSEIDAKKSVWTLTSSSAGSTYANILTWTTEGRTNTSWGIDTTATPISDIKVGDTCRVAYKVTDMNNAVVYCVGEFERSSGSTIYMTMHGLDTTIIDGGNILTNSIGANQIAGNSITASKIRIGDFNNYVTVTENDASSLIDTGTEIVDGWVHKKNDAGNTWLSPELNNWTTSDEVYRVTGKVKTPAAGRVNIYICGRDAGGVSQATATHTSVSTAANTETAINTTITITDAVANQPHSNIFVYFYTGSSGSTTQQGYFKDLKVERMAGGSLIVDGAISTNSLSVGAKDDVLNSNIQIGGKNLLIENNFTATNCTYANHTLTNTQVDSKTGIQMYVQAYNGSTYVGVVYAGSQSSTTGKRVLTFNSGIAVSAGWRLFVKHNGSTRDIGVYFYVNEVIAQSEQLTLSFNVVSSNPSTVGGLVIKDIKLERGNKATDWTPAPEDIDVHQYVTRITDAGIRIHPSATENNSVVINSDGMEVFKGGITSDYSVAKYGDTARVGPVANGYARTTINTGGMQVIQRKSNGTDITLANIGYGAGKTASGGQDTLPYYTFGIRNGTAAADIGNYSVSEGYNTKASGVYSHAEGASTNATDNSAHAEGSNTTASGPYSHSEGYGSTAIGSYSHASGLSTIANGSAQTAIGKYNKADSSSLFIIGNGSGTAASSRSNALAVSSTGHIDVGGYKLITVGTASTSSETVAGGGYTTRSVSATKAGYVAIGIVGYEVTGTNSQNVVPYRIYLLNAGDANNATAYAHVKNVGSNSYTIAVTFHILYVASGQGI